MANLTKNKDGRLRAEFYSVRDVFNTINEQKWVPQNSKSSDNRESYNDFHTFQSLAEATDIYLNHPERVREFSNADIKLESIDSPGNQVEFDIVGDYIDIGRYLDGEPESMGVTTMGNPRNVFATININLAYVHYTTNEYINHRQRRVLRLIDWLETQQIRTQVVASDVSECINASVIVKTFEDPVDLNDLAVVNHGDFFRRILFLVAEQSETWSYGYGSGMAYDTRMMDYTPQPEDGLYVYVGGYIPYSTIEELDKDFDKVEKSIAELIENNLVWNERPLTVGRKGR